jgi:prepilin-type N-terminal cleavage/methylation domain-containing protein
MKQISTNSTDGFTLGELLVSLALLSLLAIYEIQAFSTLRQLRRVEADIAAQNEVDLVASYLRHELADIRPYILSENVIAPKLLFEGKQTSMTYVSASNGERETGGLYLVTVSVDADGVLKSRRRIIQSKVNVTANEVVLLRGVEKIQFSYLARGDASKDLTNWNMDNLLPKEILVDITFAKTDERRWPSTLVRLQNSD